jgi:hypothetical protein
MAGPALSHAAASRPGAGKGASKDSIRINPSILAGDSVSRAEWDFFLAPEKAGVFAYFHGKYGAEDAPDFWTREFHGERPMDMLQARARKNLVRAKLEQRLACRAGLLPDPGWSAFLADFERENRRRAQALQEGKPVYGPKQLEMRAYYAYRQSNLVIQLKRALAKDGMAPGENAISRAYDSLKATRYRTGTGFIPYADVREGIYQQLLDAAFERLLDSMSAAR